MAASLTPSVIFHVKNIGFSEYYKTHFPNSRFCEIFGSDISSNSWCANRKSLKRTRLGRFVAKVSVAYGSGIKEHPTCVDRKEEDVDGVSDDGSVVYDHRLQFLEERNEKNLSWRLLKLSRGDKVRSALELYASMDFMGLRPESHAFNALLSCLLRNDELDDALLVFESMKSYDRTSGHSYNLILQGVAKARGFEAAFRMFEEFVSDEEHKKKVDQVLFNMMLTLCRDEKDWIKSERVWMRMKDNGCVGNSVTYRLLVTIFLTFCQYGLAIEAYLEMVQNGNGVEPDTRTTEAAIMAFAKDGRWDFALNVFRGMMKRKENPNIIIFNALIHSLGNNGQVNLAFKVYDCMKSLGHVPTSYTWNALLVSLCRAEQYGDALRLFERVQEEAPSALELHLYNTALTACKQLGSWRRALQILWEMESSGLSIPVTSYCRVIEACEVGNEPRVALQVYQRMVHQKQTPDTLTLLSLIRSCIWGSLYDEVHEILKLVPPNANLYNAAVQGFCLREKTDSATKLYQEMRELQLSADHKTRAMMLQFLPRC
ncbi:Pentatricopeptide repeat-containing protein [Artemisia annua]|uniref:Pentatricopeptide repeat-containing protein n=1 Tax=Artemisia annua TaxID=35608 RepID=A0A2U1N999_ARTAN|nr:Pentatricopeptide repeat-containing protein [Artemisia annua]